MALSPQLQQQLPAIQATLARHPVRRAWIFGSCARGEDREESDVDFLVQYDRSLKEHFSLMDIGGLWYDLHELLGRDIDLVEDGYLLPYAVESANHDKIPIYERTA